MIDWPNLAVGSLIGFVFAGLWHLIAKADADRKHRELVDYNERLVGMIAKLQQQGVVSTEKDRQGHIISVKSASISVEGSSPTLLIDPERLRDPPT